jgi:hypothetical protein
MDANIALKQELAYEWLRAVHDRYGIYYSYVNNALEGAVKELNRKNAQD